MRHGDDVTLADLTVAEGFAQCRHVHTQVDVLDHAVRPDPGHQLLLAHHFAGMGQQNQEDVHRPSAQAQWLLAFEHQALAGMNPIGAKTEGLIRGKTQQLTPAVLRRTERSRAGRVRRPSIPGCPGIILRFERQCNGGRDQNMAGCERWALGSRMIWQRQANGLMPSLRVNIWQKCA
ncbi:hypothetical protein D3C81_1633560 [compost metagenome]